MDENPYSPPTASPEAPEPPATGPLIPWEAPGGPVARAWATVRMILQDPQEAGARVGARKALGPAIGFAALVGLPFKLLEQILVVLWTPLDGGIQAAMLRKAGFPLPPAPTGEQLEAARDLHRVQGAVAVILAPVFLAIGIVLFGLIAHAGLWMFRGLERKAGLEVTLRTLLYVGGATAWVWCLLPFGLLLPESAQGLYILVNLGLSLGLLSYHGRVLAHAHGVEPWRGICGVLVPVVGLFCCLGACLASMLMVGKVG